MPRQTPSIRFKFLTGDVNWQEYGGSFISAKFNNGDWDYWYVMEVVNFDEADAKYNVSVYVVSPEAAGEEQLTKAFDSFGFDKGDLPEYFSSDIGKVEALVTYGIKAQLWSENGNNLSKLMLKAKRDLVTINGLFGFFMDSPQNGIGSTGWDLAAGNVMAGLDRYRDAKARGEEVRHSPVLKVMDRISSGGKS